MPVSKDIKQNKPTKKVYNTRSSKLDKQLKKNSDSDSSDRDDDGDDDGDDEVSTYSDSENEDEMDIHEYRKFLHKIFPSKDLKNKIISGEKVKKLATKSKSKAVEEEEEAHLSVLMYF